MPDKQMSAAPKTFLSSLDFASPWQTFHTSTAYVAGDTEKTVGPEHLGDRFKNYYEQSKAESERLVQALAPEVSTKIFRPSLIVGDSVTGRATSFPVIYIPARFAMKGLLTSVPAQPNAPCDVVPVDYVADSIAKSIRLSCESSESIKTCKSFHLTAGAGRESSPHEIREQVFETLNEFLRQSKSLPPFISPAPLLKLLTSPTAVALSTSTVNTLERIFGKKLDMVMKLMPYILYMVRNPRFDNESTIKELQLEAPKFDQYASQIFEYCLATNWGRKPTEFNPNLLDWRERELQFAVG